MPYLVYKITNTVNDKLYVGLTTLTLEERWSLHRCEAHPTRKRRQIRNPNPLYQAMSEYGIDTFAIELMEACPDEATMQEREKYWIRILATLYPQGYNKQCLLTNAEVAIIRYDAWGWSNKQYADYFGRAPSNITWIKDGTLYRHVTREHLPHGIETRAPHEYRRSDVESIKVRTKTRKTHQEKQVA